MNTAATNFNEQVALLIFQGGRHQQREDLVEEGTGSQLPRLVRHLPQRALPHRRRAVLYLQQQLHDPPLLGFLRRQHVLVDVGEQLVKVLDVVGLEEGQVAAGLVGQSCENLVFC